ncbi:MAG: hypothetical protein P1R58_04660 [bacterium]|nr:hypothetical protein [bacterium]
MSRDSDNQIRLPQVDWHKATCTVCGRSFDYCSKRRPATCKNGDCLHKYHFQIDRTKWADHQPSLFDQE